ncbi:hypothetical protein BH11BAC7_BH11BAC7_03780 [soil metagenome]
MDPSFFSHIALSNHQATIRRRGHQVIKSWFDGRSHSWLHFWSNFRSMNRLYALILLLPLISFIAGTKIPDAIVNTDADKMTSDNLGNVYLIKDESIFKYDSLGVLQKTFSNKTFGAITSANATNALRIILFYKDFNRVVTLDNTLSQNGEALTLETIGFPMTSLVAASHDNGLWIYDMRNFELLRLNRSLEVEHRSGNLSQVLGIDLQPNFIIEKDNRLFLNNPATGILVFDVFGTYSKTLPVLQLKSFQVVDNTVIYYKDGMLQADAIIINEHINYTSPVGDSTTKDMRMERNAIFVLGEKRLDIYKK